MASPTASLRHLHISAGFTAAPSLFRLSPSPCCSRAFAFPCSSVSLSAEPRRRASLFPRHFRLHTEKKGKMRRNIVVASLFGVGAPEALVIGVVALLIFGPKGLAEVARNLGKTLRAFQPTIKELQDVSRDFKSTLEREIGLDEIATSSSPTRYNSPTSVTTNQPPVVDPNGKGAYPSELTQEQLSGSDSTATVEESQDGKVAAYSSEDLLKITEEQLSASASSATTDATQTVEESKDAKVASKSSEVTPSAETQAAATAPVWWSSPKQSEMSTEAKQSEKSSETKQSEKSSD